MNSENLKHTLVVSGPSRAGKSVMEKHLGVVFPSFEASVSATTREPRPGEVNAKDYYFIPLERFRRMVRAKRFVEFADVHGNLYGTVRSVLARIRRRGKIPFFNIDVEGHGRLRASEDREFAETILSIFITVPTDDSMLEVLERRMVKTGMAKEERSMRLNSAVSEVGRKGEYDYVLENPDGHIDQTKAEFERIIKAHFAF